jgi:hypothetical protein
MKMTTPMTAVEWARSHSACSEALEWLTTLPEGATMADAWRVCACSDWMLWALHAARASTPGGPRSFACDCAERALLRERDAGREPDLRSGEAIRVARAYLAGEASAQTLAAAWDAASAAARDAARDAAWAAAWDAAWAAASAAASAAAWAAASAAASAAARDAERNWQADRLRFYVPEWPGDETC